MRRLESQVEMVGFEIPKKKCKDVRDLIPEIKGSTRVSVQGVVVTRAWYSIQS